MLRKLKSDVPQEEEKEEKTSPKNYQSIRALLRRRAMLFKNKQDGNPRRFSWTSFRTVANLPPEEKVKGKLKCDVDESMTSTDSSNADETDRLFHDVQPQHEPAQDFMQNGDCHAHTNRPLPAITPSAPHGLINQDTCDEDLSRMIARVLPQA